MLSEGGVQAGFVLTGLQELVADDGQSRCEPVSQGQDPADTGAVRSQFSHGVESVNTARTRGPQPQHQG